MSHSYISEVTADATTGTAEATEVTAEATEVIAEAVTAEATEETAEATAVTEAAVVEIIEVPAQGAQGDVQRAGFSTETVGVIISQEETEQLRKFDAFGLL